MSETQGRERREVHYRGRVHGVGFRYTARQIAGRYRVTGFVRNLADGRVQLVAEGESVELDRFLGDVAAAMEGYIDDAAESVGTATGEHHGFSVKL